MDSRTAAATLLGPTLIGRARVTNGKMVRVTHDPRGWIARRYRDLYRGFRAQRQCLLAELHAGLPLPAACANPNIKLAAVGAGGAKFTTMVEAALEAGEALMESVLLKKGLGGDTAALRIALERRAAACGHSGRAATLVDVLAGLDDGANVAPSRMSDAELEASLDDTVRALSHPGRRDLPSLLVDDLELSAEARVALDTAPADPASPAITRAPPLTEKPHPSPGPAHERAEHVEPPGHHPSDAPVSPGGFTAARRHDPDGRGCRRRPRRKPTPMTRRACTHCREPYLPKRATSRFCSARCRKAASRVRTGPVSVTPAGEVPSPALSVTSRSEPVPGERKRHSVAVANLRERPEELGEFTLTTDTIPGRRWRVRESRLQCEGMTPSGWVDVQRVGDHLELLRILTWLSDGKTLELRLITGKAQEPPGEAAQLRTSVDQMSCAVAGSHPAMEPA